MKEFLVRVEIQQTDLSSGQVLTQQAGAVKFFVMRSRNIKSIRRSVMSLSRRNPRRELLHIESRGLLELLLREAGVPEEALAEGVKPVVEGVGLAHARCGMGGGAHG